MIEDVVLLDYFRRGLIPGPTESEEAFLQRAERSIPLNHPEWAAVAQKTLPLCGCGVDWVPISYSNKKLAWWEGAATWISDHPTIQLRRRFQKGSYLGYDRNDVLAHEAIHAARVKFEEPFFEEILAYTAAPQRWKQLTGPLFVRSWEPLFLIAALIAGGLWWWIPLMTLAILIERLAGRHRLFNKCRRALSLPVVLCMTDAEIKNFKSKEQFQAYLQTQSSLRCHLMDLIKTKDQSIVI